MPEVSVVIPTRSRWHLLSAAGLPSALAQEDVEHEVIVVDDGSSDETAARLAKVDDAHLRVVRHETSLGLSSARNSGIEAAAGEWVSFLDDDDLWAPRKLRIQLDAMRDTRSSFAYGASVVVDGQGNVTAEHLPPDPATLAAGLRSRYTIPAGCSNVLVKTELVRRLGGFDVNLWHLQDWDLWIRLARASSGVAVPDVLVGYVLHGDNSFLGDRTHDVIDDLEYLVAKYGSGPEGMEIDTAGFTRWVAFRLRGAGERRRAARTYLRGAVAHRSPSDVLRAGYALAYGGPVGRMRGTSAPSGDPPAFSGPVPEWLDRYRSAPDVQRR
ncbi:MAG: glycosyltransferase family 2 protein [Gaiellaceae bacterium]